MATVRTKGSDYTGTVGAASFVDGVAEVSTPTLLAHFRRHPDRYEVADDEQPAEQRLTVPETITLPEDDGENEPDPEDDSEDDDSEDEQPEGDPSEADPYDVGREQLRDMARDRGLSTSGSKPELQARLREADAARDGEQP